MSTRRLTVPTTTSKPSGKNQVQGIRLYRTLSTVADTEYLRLATLWFPVTVDTVVGTTVTTVQPHNLAVGNYFKISTGVSGRSLRSSWSRSRPSPSGSQMSRMARS